MKNSSLDLLCLLPYYGQSAGTALNVKGWQGCRTACLRKRIGKALHQNSKSESLSRIGCLSWFVFKTQGRKTSKRRKLAMVNVEVKPSRLLSAYTHYRAHPRHFRSEYVRGYLHRQAMCTAFQASCRDYSP